MPNKHGGRENLEAIEFLRRFNREVFGKFPNATTAAEESTAWPQVSRPIEYGGLGFGYKWNMGWMHDTLNYISKDPIYRKHHHDQILFGLHYAFSENFILPLSHDEVVHGKRSILGRMPGDNWQRFANLRAYYAFMFAHPGQEADVHGLRIRPGARVEPRSFARLAPARSGRASRRPVAGARPQSALSATAGAARTRLQSRRASNGSITDDSDRGVFAWMRKGQRRPRAMPGRRELYAECLSRLSGLRVPFTGTWREVLNTDSAHYGGSNVGNGGTLRDVERRRTGTEPDDSSSRSDLPRAGNLQ